MRSSEFITEAERPGMLRRGLNRLQAKLPGFLGGNTAAGRVDTANFTKQMIVKFDRWRGQAGLDYGKNLTGAEIAAKFGTPVMIKAMAEVIPPITDDSTTAVSAKQVKDLLQTFAELTISGRGGTAPAAATAATPAAATAATPAAATAATPAAATAATPAAALAATPAAAPGTVPQPHDYNSVMNYIATKMDPNQATGLLKVISEGRLMERGENASKKLLAVINALKPDQKQRVVDQLKLTASRAKKPTAPAAAPAVPAAAPAVPAAPASAPAAAPAAKKLPTVQANGRTYEDDGKNYIDNTGKKWTKDSEMGKAITRQVKKNPETARTQDLIPQNVHVEENLRAKYTEFLRES